MILLFIGPSGSGKDTQAELLVRDHAFERISSGDLVRDVSEGPHRIQKLIIQGMNKGFLPDMFVNGLLQVYLTETDHKEIILTGSVRRFRQIDLLDTGLKDINRKLDKVIYFELNDDEAIKRMSGRMICPNCDANYHLITNPPKKVDICDNCGARLERREDDLDLDSVKKRLEEFHKENLAIVKEYEKRGLLARIDASKSIEEIHTELKKILNLA